MLKRVPGKTAVKPSKGRQDPELLCSVTQFKNQVLILHRCRPAFAKGLRPSPAAVPRSPQCLNSAACRRGAPLVPEGSGVTWTLGPAPSSAPAWWGGVCPGSACLRLTAAGTAAARARWRCGREPEPAARRGRARGPAGQAGGSAGRGGARDPQVGRRDGQVGPGSGAAVAGRRRPGDPRGVRSCAGAAAAPVAGPREPVFPCQAFWA